MSEVVNLDIPLIYLKDKQAFTKNNGPMRLIGKPLDTARELQQKGYQLIHFVDTNAINGLSTNLDVYDGLTYFINLEVECAPNENFVMKLLSLKCRVILIPDTLDVTKIKEKKLLVAKILDGYSGNADGFHDVILENADDKTVKKFNDLGKRVIIHQKDKNKIKEKVWGIIIPFS